MAILMKDSQLADLHKDIIKTFVVTAFIGILLFGIWWFVG